MVHLDLASIRHINTVRTFCGLRSKRDVRHHDRFVPDFGFTTPGSLAFDPDKVTCPDCQEHPLVLLGRLGRAVL
jgi:hypothetical protein